MVVIEVGSVFLAGGLPSPSLIPANELQNIFQQLAVNKRIDPLSHCPVQGTHELRVQIKQLMLKRGVTANINEQLITSGSQQALDLVIRSFIKEGDVVIAEEPTFFWCPTTISTCRSKGDNSSYG